MEQEILINQNDNQEILINSNDPQLIQINNVNTQDLEISQNNNQDLEISQPDNQVILINGGGNVIGITDVLVNGVSVVSGNIAYVLVPTKTSELQNDSGFITSETDPTVPSYVKQISLADINSWNNKQDELVSGSNIKTINNESLLGNGNITITGTEYTAGTGIDIDENNVISNTITSYEDLSDLPSIPEKVSDLTNDLDFVRSEELSEVAFTGSYASLSNTPEYLSEFVNDSGYITNTVNDLTNYTLTSNLSSVATSGSYNDLTNLPTIPTATSQLTNDSGFITNSVNNLTNYMLSTDINTALGNKQDTLVSGTNIKTINNTSLLGSGDITIGGGSATDVQINGTSITSGGVADILTQSTYNSSTNKIATVNDIPTKTSELTNDSNFATTGDIAKTITLNNEWIMGWKSSGDSFAVMFPLNNPNKTTPTVNLTSAQVYSGGWQTLTVGNTDVFETFIVTKFSTTASLTNGNVYLVRLTGTITI